MTYSEAEIHRSRSCISHNPTRAYTAYLAGINANMDKLQVPAGTERTDYLTFASVGSGS
jgi:hypothetical protein